MFLYTMNKQYLHIARITILACGGGRRLAFIPKELSIKCVMSCEYILSCEYSIFTGNEIRSMWKSINRRYHVINKYIPLTWFHRSLLHEDLFGSMYANV